MALCRLAAAALLLSPVTALRQARTVQVPEATQPVEQAAVVVEKVHVITDQERVHIPVKPEEMEVALREVEIRPQKIAKRAHDPEPVPKSKTQMILPKVYPPLRKVEGVINPEGRIVVTANSTFLDLLETGYKETIYYGCSYGPTMYGEVMTGTISAHYPVVVVLTQVFSGAMYHTIAESFSRLAHIKAQEPALMATAKFHIGCTADWCKDWAVMFGLASDQIVDGFVSCDTCIWPESTPCARVDTTMIREANEVLNIKTWGDVSIYPYETISAPYHMRALVISHSGGRKVGNEYEVKHLLREEGFQDKVLSDNNLPSVMEQCRSFYCSDIVVSPHGNLLTLLVCARPYIPVLEFHQNDPNDHFQFLANKLKMNYHGLFADLPRGGTGNVSIRKTRTQLHHAMHKLVIAEFHGHLQDWCS